MPEQAAGRNPPSYSGIITRGDFYSAELSFPAFAASKPRLPFGYPSEEALRKRSGSQEMLCTGDAGMSFGCEVSKFSSLRKGHFEL